MDPLLVRLPPDLLAWLDGYVEHTGEPRERVIVRLLEELRHQQSASEPDGDDRGVRASFWDED